MGCSPEVNTVRELQPLTSYGGVIDGEEINTFDIIGEQFGSDPGSASIAGVPLEVLVWKPARIGVKLTPDSVSGELEVVTADGSSTTGPTILINQGPVTPFGALVTHLNDYAVQNSFPSEWIEWFESSNGHIGHYNRAHQRAVVEDHVYTVAYYYHEDVPYPRFQDFPLPDGIDPDALTPEEYEQLQEFQHMEALEAFHESVYPGYDFTFVFEGSVLYSDAVVYANVPPPVIDGISGKFQIGYDATEDLEYLYVLATQEGVLPHELGHTLGIAHHYSGSVNGLHMPPGESICIMNQTGNTWCSACAAALRLEGAQDGLQSQALLDELRTYIDDTGEPAAVQP